MTEENGEKNWLTNLLNGKALVELKNQLAERLKAHFNIKFQLFNKTIINNNFTLPEKTDPKDVADFLAKIPVDDPKIESIQFKPNQIKWIIDNFPTIAYSSAATVSTLSTVASTKLDAMLSAGNDEKVEKMAEENEEKKTKREKLTEFMSKKVLLDLRNEANALKAADNIGEFKPTVNIHIGDVYHKTVIKLPDNTDPKRLADILEAIHVEVPDISKITLDDADKKWIIDNFGTVAYSSAATLSRLTAGNLSFSGEVKASVKRKDKVNKD